MYMDLHECHEIHQQLWRILFKKEKKKENNDNITHLKELLCNWKQSVVVPDKFSSFPCYFIYMSLNF